MRFNHILLLALVACSNANASSLTHTGHQRAVATVGSSARFTFAAACESGELTPTRSPLHVPSGSAVVVKITPCNASAGDRMAVYVSSPSSCNAATDSKIGTNGDGGSDPGGANFAVIAGLVPCTGSYFEVTDLASGAVQDVTIVVP